MTINKKVLVLIICLFCLIALGGCKKQYVQDGESNLVMNNNDLAESDSVAELAKRASQVKNIAYEVSVKNEAGKVQTQDFWLNNDKMRIESAQDGKPTIFIAYLADKFFYEYTPNDGKAIKMDLSQLQSQSIFDQAETLQQYNLENIGSETIDSKNCIIVKYKFGGLAAKAWLWKKYGLPLKIENETLKGTVTTTFSKFDFSLIKDSMFEIPAGVQIADKTILPLPGTKDIEKLIKLPN